MRISLLQRREPFTQIFEQTLAQFLSAWQQRPFAVRWLEKGAEATSAGQIWYGNIYLNAIFVAGNERAMFGPIRQEFARSPIWWKRPLQRLYVALATQPLTAPLLAQARVQIDPPLAEANTLLLVGGNHKIRLLDHQNGLTYSVVKAGFSTRFFEQEVAARQAAEANGLSVPPLLEVGENGRWLSEQYVSGTPINRLANRAEAAVIAEQAARELHQLAIRTAAQQSLESYVAELADDIRQLLDGNHLLSASQKQAWRALSSQLVGLIGQMAVGNQQILLGLSHGDFQPANVLQDGSRFWLIDWEYAARRQIGYDVLVYLLETRFPTKLGERLIRFVSDGSSAFGLDEQTGEERLVKTAVFILEEFSLRLQENDNPQFLQLGDSLFSFVAEVEQWQQQLVKERWQTKTTLSLSS